MLSATELAKAFTNMTGSPGLGQKTILLACLSDCFFFFFLIFLFSETGSLIFYHVSNEHLCQELFGSTGRQHLLYSYERTENIFFFVMTLPVATSFKKNSDVCIQLEIWAGFVNKNKCMYLCQHLQLSCLIACFFLLFYST